MTTLNYADTTLAVTGCTDDYHLLLAISTLNLILFGPVIDAVMKKWPKLSEGLTNGGLKYITQQKGTYSILS